MAFTPTSGSSSYSPTLPFETEKVKQRKLWNPFTKWLGREENSPRHEIKQETEMLRPSIGRKLSKKVVPGLPRPGTFRRQMSERRERLTVNNEHEERRALSVDRKRARAVSARPPSPPPAALPTLPTQSVYNGSGFYHGSLDSFPMPPLQDSQPQTSQESQLTEEPSYRPAPPPSPPPDLPNESELAAIEEPGEEPGEDDMRRELEERWILNLSMHFRDRSPREKFFVTYAETPTKWRRVTVSIDYRDAPPESLERDLQTLQYQRDKSARIYEAIRTSLLDIQFYDTVTNLRLETSPDERLHVHVTEDVNEIIQYPSINLVQHLKCKKVAERDVHFDSHMSGFVYKVKVDDRICIKKEIPGPDSVEEFLYEINALHTLMGAQNVVQFEGLVLDDDYTTIKGLLISYAEKGPLVDLIYDDRGHLTWDRRERWAHEIVTGLSEIHEAGFVQGDFTLSNIVIDENDKACIIDINRRGCPVGWEPPEIAKMIESGQRISMYIGVKSDLFQLGMVLWALGEEEDEPERQQRPLNFQDSSKDIPAWYQELTLRCLSDSPRDRLSANALLSYFNHRSGAGLPAFSPVLESPLEVSPRRSRSRSRPSDTQYIDPQTAVGHEDLRASQTFSRNSRNYSDSHTYFENFERPSSLDIPFDGPDSYYVPSRGRTPPINSTHLRSNSRSLPELTRNRSASPAYEPQVVPISPGSHEHKWEEFQVGERSYLFDFHEAPEGRPRELSPDSPVADLGQRREAGDKAEDCFKPMEHIDSGLGDMHSYAAHRTPFASSSNSKLRALEHIDSGLADMDLSGVGGNDIITGYAKQEPQIGLESGGDITIEEETGGSQEGLKSTFHDWSNTVSAENRTQQVD